jgi:molecular chaperone HscB
VSEAKETHASFPSRCVECGAALVSPLVCIGCPELKPLKEDLDHFARLGIERNYDIDLAELEKRYLVLARGLHPDQFAGRAPHERAIAEQLSAQLNESYKSLRDPVMRAEYLLQLEHGASRDQDKRTPKDFLVEMLELNESIEELEGELAGGGAEPATAREKLAELRDEIHERNEAIVASLPGLFRSLRGAGEAERAATLLKIREQLNVCAYLQGLVAQTRELLLR